MSKISDNNFIVIQAFMVKDLNLKGMELLVYAIIFGFSQAEDTQFTGSLKYLMEWTQSSKYGVMKSLTSLVDKGLIVKEEKFINGVKFVSYSINKVDPRSTELTTRQLSCPNNIDNLSIIDTSLNSTEELERKKEEERKKEFVPPTLEEVKEYAQSRNSSVDPVKFYEYFCAGNWIDSKGAPVRNWRQKLITWEGRGKRGLPSDAPKPKKQFNIHYDNE